MRVEVPLRGDGPAPRVREVTALPRTATGAVDLDATVASLSRLGTVHVLESAGGEGGWSYVVPAPSGRLVVDADGSRLQRDGTTEHLGSDPFAAIDRLCARWGLTPEATPTVGPAFTGGLVGALGYDLARHIERLPGTATADRALPHAELLVAESVLALDDARARAMLVQRPLVSPPRRLDRSADAIAASLARPVHPSSPPHQPQAAGTTLAAEAYRGAVRAALELIAAGETFQVNLSQRLTARWRGDVHQLYRALRGVSPAPYGAALALSTCGVASISPEVFLEARGRDITTRPIKGTRPRDPDPARDHELGRTLARSDKDRAENVMVVDMERNDLGRVCEPGSVAVPELLRLERHPTVWHLVSTVTGRLRSGVGWGRLLRASFPSGSVTGTPKVRAMAAIDDLEPTRRGFYCGAHGYLSAGAACLSVSIRTATLLADGRVDYGAGGGVVAESDPAAELAESLDKAAAFLQAVDADEVVAGTTAA